MLAVCPRCGDIHEGIAAHCPRCFSRVLTVAQRKYSARASSQLCATRQQRELLFEVTRPMGHDELQELVLRMVDVLAPIERTWLIECALAIRRDMANEPA